METKKTYHGFKLLKKEKVLSIGSEVFLFRHNKTGAELLYVKNKDPERLYVAGFRTPADDDTGKSHIFEHATMMSSEKYPVRDAFIGMYRGAHTSFLNAMTFPDKTVYPVGSTNKQEFRKLVDVYTDLAFRPQIHNNKNIFLQEGVRFELDEKDTLSLNGVVFNEMKGALSSPDRQLEEQAMNVLFPDNTYQYCSGGLPEKIPTLTYKKLVAYHKKCYHPSNAHFFFYGDITISTYLRYLDDEYLSQYTKQPKLVIKKQRTRRLQDVTDKYTSASEHEQYSFGFKLDSNTSELNRLATEILFELLMGDTHAPLKKVLIDSGIAQDYDHLYEDEIQDLFAMVFAKNAKKGSGKKFKKIIIDELTRLVTEGIPEELVSKTLTKYELLLKSIEDSTGKGLHMYRAAETAWLYGGDPIKRLQETELFYNKKSSFTPKFLEKLINRLLLNNQHSCLYTLTPTKKDLQKDALDTLLAEETKKLTPAKKKALRKESQEFKAWQNDKTLPEFNEFFPTLPLKQIEDEDVYAMEPEIQRSVGVTYLWNKAPKQALEYISIRFDISHISYKDMPYVELVVRTLKESATKEFSAVDVVSTLTSDTLGFGFSIDGFDTKKSEPRVHLQMSYKSLPHKREHVLRLIRSMLQESILDRDKVTELFTREIARMESAMVDIEARTVLQMHTFAKLYAHGTYEEYAGGISYLESLRAMYVLFKKNPEKELKKMNKIYNQLFVTKGAYVAGLTHKNDLVHMMQELQISKKTYPAKKVRALSKKDELFLSESMSNYNSLGIQTKNQSPKEKAARSLLGAVLNPNYLWKQLRDKGGAYGGALMPSSYDDLILLSWRDPRIAGTYDDYHSVLEYISDTEISNKDVHQAKISLFSKLDAPLTKQQQLERAVSRVITGRTNKSAQNKRRYIKTMSTQVFKRSAQKLVTNIERGVKTTIGRKDTSVKIRKGFDEVKKI